MQMILYYVKKGNSFSYVLFSLLWTDLSLLVKLTSEIYLRYLSKIHLSILYSSSIF